MQIKKVFVAGAGLMGGGIAQVCAQAGYDVTMRDISDDILEKSLKAIRWSVGKFVEKKGLRYLVDTAGRDLLTIAAIVFGMMLPLITRRRAEIAISIGIALYLLYIVRIGRNLLRTEINGK